MTNRVSKPAKVFLVNIEKSWKTFEEANKIIERFDEKPDKLELVKSFANKLESLEELLQITVPALDTIIDILNSGKYSATKKKVIELRDNLKQVSAKCTVLIHTLCDDKIDDLQTEYITDLKLGLLYLNKSGRKFIENNVKSKICRVE